MMLLIGAWATGSIAQDSSLVSIDGLKITNPAETPYQKVFAPLKEIVSHPEENVIAQEVETLIPHSLDVIKKLIDRMIAKESEVETEQDKYMRVVYPQVFTSLTKLQKDCNTKFMAEKELGQKERLKEEYATITRDISMVESLPKNYIDGLGLPATQRTHSPADILITLAAISSKYNLETISWQSIHIEPASSSIASEVWEIRALWKKLEDILVQKNRSDINFKWNPHLVATSITLQTFMGATINAQKKPGVKNYVEDFFVRGDKTKWLIQIKGVNANITNKNGAAIINWGQINPEGNMNLIYNAEIPKSKLSQAQTIVFNFKFDWLEDVAGVVRIKLRGDDWKELSGGPKGDGTFEVNMEEKDFPKKWWKLQATISIYSKSGIIWKKTITISEPKLILIEKVKN